MPLIQNTIHNSYQRDHKKEVIEEINMKHEI